MASRLASALALLTLTLVLTLGVLTSLLRARAPTSTPRKPRTPRAFLRRWASAWSDYSALRDAPLGEPLAELVAALHAHQNPSNCARAHFLLFEYRSSLGFGAQIRHLLVAFYAALQTRRVLLLSERHPFYWASGCETRAHNRRFTCHFRALSDSCPFAAVDALRRRGALRVVRANYSSVEHWARYNAYSGAPSVMILSQQQMGDRFPSFLHAFPKQRDFEAQLRWLLPRASRAELAPDAAARRLWLSAAAFYVTRLNARSASHVRAAVARVLRGAHWPSPANLIGAPLRASDKCRGNRAHRGPGEMDCVTLAEVGDTVMRLALMQPALTHVVLSSEDAAAVSDHKVRAAFGAVAGRQPLRVLRFENDLSPGTGNTNRVLSKLRVKQARLLRSMLVVLHLQALAELHVLTPRSTFHSLIAALANTTPGKRRHVTFPLGSWRDLNASVGSQLLR